MRRKSLNPCSNGMLTELIGGLLYVDDVEGS